VAKAGIEAMTFGTRLLTWFRGELVGVDSFGNRYYRERGSKPLRRGGGRFSRSRPLSLGEGAPAEHDRHAFGLLPAGLSSARR